MGSQSTNTLCTFSFRAPISTRRREINIERICHEARPSTWAERLDRLSYLKIIKIYVFVLHTSKCILLLSPVAVFWCAFERTRTFLKISCLRISTGHHRAFRATGPRKDRWLRLWFENNYRLGFSDYIHWRYKPRSQQRL